MTDAAKKRAYVSDLYSGKGWKHKVSRMHDDQVVAIYLKHQGDGEDPEPYSPEEDGDTIDFPESALPHPIHGPHQNEDDFPMY